MSVGALSLSIALMVFSGIFLLSATPVLLFHSLTEGLARFTLAVWQVWCSMQRKRMFKKNKKTFMAQTYDEYFCNCDITS